MQNISREYYNTYQLKLPLEISTIIDISDPVYSFNEVMNHGVKFGKREEYAIEYLEEIQSEFVSLTGYEPTAGVSGRGHHKSKEISMISCGFNLHKFFG